MQDNYAAHATILRPTTLAIATHVLGFASLFHPAALLAQPQPVCPPLPPGTVGVEARRANGLRLREKRGRMEKRCKSEDVGGDGECGGPDDGVRVVVHCR